jgi:excisionase family DNA binding protein
MLQVAVAIRPQNRAPTKTPPDFLTVTQAAKFLGTLRQGVLMAIYRGRLEAHRYGNAWLIERRVLEPYRATTKTGRPAGTKKKKLTSTLIRSWLVIHLSGPVGESAFLKISGSSNSNEKDPSFMTAGHVKTNGFQTKAKVDIFPDLE